MKRYKIYKFAFLIFLFTAIYACVSEENDVPQDIEINDFVWRGMNAYYYWQNEIPDLADKRFTSQPNLNNYLMGFQTPEDLFQAVRYQPGTIDRFSWIVDDYIALENSFQGITLNNGMEFKLFRNKTNTSNVHGIVYYVIPNSDAALKGVLREMVFTAVNGTQLTDTNYEDLLFGANPNYTINLANYNTGNPTLNGNTIDLSKTQLQENPVAITKVFTEGSSKIGYLLYNQFASNYDDELNAAFATFEAEAVKDLIVDLRYNGGGSVRTSTYLASMITGQFNGKLYAKEFWNEKVMKETNPDFFLNNFTNQIDNGTIKKSINSLKLTSVYFIVSENTASASELVINGLSAYIDVKLVGTKTVGKQVGSITLYDSDLLTKNGPNFNTNHTYAIQPIVLEIKNAEGKNEPNGYSPGQNTTGVNLPEDFGQISGNVNLGVLGNKSDPLLERTINYITTGSKSSGKFINLIKKEQITNSKLQRPFSQEMFVEGFRE